MTDYYGVNYDRSEIDVPQTKLPIGDLGGRLRISYDSHTFAAELTTSDKLIMNRLPKGAKIIDVIFSHPDLGTTGLFNIGHDGGDNDDETADPDAFFAAVNVKAAAGRVQMSNGVGGDFKEMADDCWLEIVPTENTDAANGLEIHVCVLYVIE